MRQAIASSLHLFTVLIFFSAGCFIFSLPFLPELRIRMADWILNRYEICTPIALVSLLSALLLLIGFYGLNRGKVLRIEMGPHLASVDAELVRQTLEECFRRQFPQQIRLLDVEIIGAKKIEIGVSLAPLEKTLRDDLYINAEKALTLLLRERFGYTKTFYLLVKTS